MMLQEPWKHLKSGTDIRGVALEGAPGQSVDLTDEIIGSIAAAFALWLQNKTGKKKNTGHRPRQPPFGPSHHGDSGKGIGPGGL